MFRCFIKFTFGLNSKWPEIYSVVLVGCMTFIIEASKGSEPI